MQSESQCEDAWWTGALVIGGVFGVQSFFAVCPPPPFSSHLAVRAERLLLGCPPRLVQQTGARGTPVSDFSSPPVIGSGDVCGFQYGRHVVQGNVTANIILNMDVTSEIKDCVLLLCSTAQLAEENIIV